MTTHVERSIEVAVPVRTAYDQWTQFEEFPQFMSGVQEVRQIGDALTHWVAEIAGVRREWDAAIVEQVPDQKVAWAATSGATNAGAVYFQAVGDDRTQVRLTLDYEPEGFVERVADVLDVVERRAVTDLDRFKEFIEQRGSATGGWRGRVDEGDVQAGATGTGTGGADAGGIAGDVVSVGPTGDTRGTVTTEAGPARPSAAAESGESPGVGHSGDPVVVQDRTVTGRADEDDAERTGTAAGAATSSAAGTAGFGTDTGLSSDDPASGAVTGNPDPGGSSPGSPQPARTTERTGTAAGAATSSAAGAAGFGTDTGLSSDDPASGAVTGNPDPTGTSRTEVRDEPSAGFITGYPGGNPAARAAEADESSAGFETGTPGEDRAARAADAEESRAGFVTGYPGGSTKERGENADESGTNFLTGYPGERTEGAGGTWTDQPAAREGATEAATDPVGEPWSSGTDVADRSRETGSATTGMGGARPGTASDPDDRQKPSV